MNESTDLEICQRIAKIEGVKVRKCDGVICILEATGSSLMKIPTTEYNPLTDDALCFKLMIKYKVSLTYGEYAVNAEILIEKEDGDYSFSSQTYCPKRAICLAIIKPKE
jgi:hypothetical protein